MKFIFTFVCLLSVLLLIQGVKVKKTAAQKAASQAARQVTRLQNQAQKLANSNMEASAHMGRAPSPPLGPPPPFSRVVEYNNGGKIRFTQLPGQPPQDMMYHHPPVKVLSIPPRDLPIALVPRNPVAANVAVPEPVAGPSGTSRANSAQAAAQGKLGPRATAAAAAIAAAQPSVSLGQPAVTITFGVGRRAAAAAANQPMGPRALAASAAIAAANKAPPRSESP